MKIKFLNANYGIKYTLPKDFIATLKKVMKKQPNKKVAVYCAVQFLPKLNETIEIINNQTNFKATSSKLDRATFKGQILGCDSYKHNLNIDIDEIGAFVYIGDGMFHPNALLFAQEHETDTKDIVIINAVESTCEIITRVSIDKHLKKKRGNLMKYHTSTNIGVFISSKWGQEYKDSALNLKKIYPNKNFYFFVGDNFIEQEMENFPFVECWVNTACPRIGQDDIVRQSKPVVNIKDIYNK